MCRELHPRRYLHPPPTADHQPTDIGRHIEGQIEYRLPRYTLTWVRVRTSRRIRTALFATRLEDISLD